MIIILLVIFTTLALLDLPGLIRQKHRRELAIYSGLMLTALVLSVLLVMGVPLPAVTTEIGKFIDWVLGLGSASK